MGQPRRCSMAVSLGKAGRLTYSCGEGWLSHTLLGNWTCSGESPYCGSRKARTLGDLLTKPFAHGGMNLGRISSSLVIAIFIVGCVLFESFRPGLRPGSFAWSLT